MLSFRKNMFASVSLLRWMSTANSKWKIMKTNVLVCPAVRPENTEEDFVTGIRLTPQEVVWAVQDVAMKEIVDFGSYQLFTENSKSCLLGDIIDLAFRVKEKLPASGLYVMEEIRHYSKDKLDLSVLNSLLIFDSMLTALLNEGYKPDHPIHKVFHMPPSIIMKLYNLKVGEERMSSQFIIHKMIRKSAVFGNTLFGNQIDISMVSEDVWIGRLRWPSVERARRIWGQGDVWRENISNAILVSTAFSDLCLQPVPEALSKVFAKDNSSHSRRKKQPLV